MSSARPEDLREGPKICAVLLQHGHASLTLACLDALAASVCPPNQVVVCDNGSEPQAVAAVRYWAAGHPDLPVLVIENHANAGFAKGNNPGLRHALEHGFDFVWCLNNDTEPAPAALAALLGHADAHPRAGIIGATVVEHDRPEVLQCAGGCRYDPLTTVMTPRLAGATLAEAVSDPQGGGRMDYVYGASLFLRADMLREIGLFHEGFFLFYEEIDLCARARKAGWDIDWCPQAVVRHKGGASIGKPGDSTPEGRARTAFANYHENLSTLLYTWRHHKMLLPAAFLFRFLGKLAAVLRRGEGYLVRPLLRAYRDFLLGRNLRNRA